MEYALKMKGIKESLPKNAKMAQKFPELISVADGVVYKVIKKQCECLNYKIGVRYAFLTGGISCFFKLHKLYRSELQCKMKQVHIEIEENNVVSFDELEMCFQYLLEEYPKIPLKYMIYRKRGESVVEINIFMCTIDIYGRIQPFDKHFWKSFADRFCKMLSDAFIGEGTIKITVKSYI